MDLKEMEMGLALQDLMVGLHYLNRAIKESPSKSIKEGGVMHKTLTDMLEKYDEYQFKGVK